MTATAVKVSGSVIESFYDAVTTRVVAVIQTASDELTVRTVQLSTDASGFGVARSLHSLRGHRIEADVIESITAAGRRARIITAVTGLGPDPEFN